MNYIILLICIVEYKINKLYCNVILNLIHCNNAYRSCYIDSMTALDSYNRVIRVCVFDITDNDQVSYKASGLMYIVQV